VRHSSYCQQVLNRTVGVEEGGAHGPINVSARKTHAFHIGNGGLALATHG
jgi:hypothetical protein